MDKNADLTLNISPTSSQYTATKIRFSTQDGGSAKLTFFLFKEGVELPLNGVTGKIAMRMADGSKFVDTVTLADKQKGIIEYKLTQEQLKHFGQVVAELYLNYVDGQKISVHRFSFRIEQALIDADIAVQAEYYIDDFESLKATITDMVDETKEVINTVGINVEEAKGIAEETISLIEQHQVVKRNDEGIFSFNIFNEETRRILQGLSPGQINAVLGFWNVLSENISRKSIDPTKLVGNNVVNVFNPATAKDGYRLGGTDSATDITNDIQVADTNFVTTDFIECKLGDIKTVDATSSANTIVARIYDKNKKPLKNVRNTTAWVGMSVTIDHANAAFIKFNIPVNSVPKTQKMVVEGSTYPTSYVPYMQTVLDWLALKAKSVNLSVLSDEVITEINKNIKAERLEGITSLPASANLLNPSKVTTGKRVAKSSTFPGGGEIFVDDVNWGFTDYFAASSGDTLTCKGVYSAGVVIVMIYDANKVPIAAITETVSWVSPRTVTLPTDSRIAYVRFNLNLQNTVPGNLMIVKGSVYPTDLIAYTGNFRTLDWLTLLDNSVSKSQLTADLQAILTNTSKEVRKLMSPRKVYARMDLSDKLRIYYRGIVSSSDLNNLIYKATYLEGISKIRKDHFALSKPSNAGSPVDTFYIHDAKTGVLVESKSITIVWTDPNTKANPSTSKNILVFGDSFTQAGIYSRELNDYLVTQKGWSNFKFIGQKTDFGVRHQGMGGYAIRDFVIPPEQMRANFNNNPFYNPATGKLDFKYYMSNNGFTGDIDYLYLGHGINDVLTYSRTPEQIVADIKTFIDQLHVDYPNCKILLGGLVPLSPLNDMYSVYLHNNKVLDVNKAYDDFAAGSSYSSFVTYVPVAAEFNADYAYDYEMKVAYKNSTEQVKVLKDWLHPYDPGYCMISNQIVSALLSII